MTSVQQRQKLLGLNSPSVRRRGALEPGLPPDRPFVSQRAALAAHAGGRGGSAPFGQAALCMSTQQAA
jgi:hypothetical protein